MFQFPRCPPVGLSIQPPVSTLARRRVAPFGVGRLIARLQLPAHVSPLSASFLGPWPLGILPAPLYAWQELPSHVGVFTMAVSGHGWILLLASAKLKQTHYVVVKVLLTVRLDN